MDFLKRTTVDINKAYFTSDWHLGHVKMLTEDNEPFDNIWQKNQKLIEEACKLTEDDHLFYQGDLSFLKPKETLELILPIKAKLYWVAGNHDTKLFKYKPLRDLFEWILPQAEIYLKDDDEKIKVVLNHYAMKKWNKSHYGSYHLYAHTHTTLAEDETLSFDVCAKGWDYCPVSGLQVKEKMLRKRQEGLESGKLKFHTK